MKHSAIIIPLLAAALLVTACSQSSPKETLASRLEQAAAASDPLYGHQDDLMYGHSWQSDSTLQSSDVYAVAGAYPAVLGLDLGGIELGCSHNLDGNDFSLMREAVRKHVERGGVVTLSWHLRNPYTGGDAWDTSAGHAVVESILPGGANHEMFLGWLDAAAEYIKSLDVSLVWRPWHEHSGGWFWWGAQQCTPEQYNALWKMTYEYFTEEKGIDNILWAISPNSTADFEAWEERYPGDEYVDIVGLDCYCSAYVPMEEAVPEFRDNLARCLSSLASFASAHGKILALTETGYEAIPHHSWWTEVLQPAIENYPLAYVLTWRNACDRPEHYHAPWPGSPDARDFIDWTKTGNNKLLQ